MKQFALALCMLGFAVVANAQEAKSIVVPVDQKVSKIQDATPAPSSVVQEKKPAVEPTPGAVKPAEGSKVAVAGAVSGCCGNPCCCQPRFRIMSRLRGRFGGMRRWR